MMILGSDHRVFTDLSAVPAFSTTPDSPQALATAQAVVVGFVDETRHGVHSDLIRTGGAAFPLRRFP